VRDEVMAPLILNLGNVHEWDVLPSGLRIKYIDIKYLPDFSVQILFEILFTSLNVQAVPIEIGIETRHVR
jgi:hypothetical protein